MKTATKDKICAAVISYLKESGSWKSSDEICAALKSVFVGRMYELTPRELGGILSNCPSVLFIRGFQGIGHSGSTLYHYRGVTSHTIEYLMYFADFCEMIKGDCKRCPFAVFCGNIRDGKTLNEAFRGLIQADMEGGE